MKEKLNFTPDLIRQYCDYFYEIAINAVFVPGTYIKFKAVEFNAGVILQVTVQPKAEDQRFNNSTEKPIPYFCYTSVFEAFKELQIDLDNYLSEDHQMDLVKAINDDSSYFEGTFRFYGQTMDEIFIVKEKKEELWTVDAAKQDLENWIQDNASLS